MRLPPEELLQMYEQMVTIRKFEEGVSLLNMVEGCVGVPHLYIGEEAVAVGVCHSLRETDTITSTHRGHGHCIAKGCDLDRMMAEIFGKRAGYCKGKGGSMHIADFRRGIIGANGIVAASIPIATGCALSSKLRGTDQVTVCFFGDGASNHGAFHEAVNLAAVLNLPIVYLCENNFYGISGIQAPGFGMKTSRVHQTIRHVADRAAGYNIPGRTVDGNDLLAVHEAAREAIERARDGAGPMILECLTYRWRQHCELDERFIYRTEEEVRRWMEKCPIKRFAEYLLRRDVLTEERAREIDREVQSRVDAAVEFARQSPFPDPSEALEEIYLGRDEEGRPR
ncbi:MAG: thiamine pyrophosphate-dependent dehydrogenase E1 component subunit alpha [Planctomycetota bacterium]